MSPPDTRDCGRMHAHFFGHEPATPMGGIGRLFLQRLAHDLGFIVECDSSWSARTRPVLKQGVDAFCFIPVEPLRHRGPGYTHGCTEASTILARSTTRWGVVLLLTHCSKRLRSPRRNRILRIGSPMQTKYCLRYDMQETYATLH